MADRDAQAALAAEFSVTVDGADLPPEARGMVSRISVEDSLDAAATFALELNNWDHDRQQVRWSDDSLFKPGGAVAIKLGYLANLVDVLTGEITGLELSFPPDVRSRLVVRGYDRFHRVRGGRRTKTYLQAKDSDVAQQVASGLGLTGNVEDSGEVHPYLLQVNQTDVDFLLTRARAIGYELFLDDKTLVFRKRKHDRGKTETLSFTTGLLAFDGYLSTADQVDKVTVRGWDPQAKQALVGQAQPSDIASTMNGSQSGAATMQGAFGDRTLAVVEHPVSTQNEADLLARGLMNEVALGFVRAEVTAVGTPTIGAGAVVEIDGVGARFGGLYYVTRVTHVFAGSLVTHFHARRTAA
jgi:Bacteriophage probable baseplate hub protein